MPPPGMSGSSTLGVLPYFPSDPPPPDPRGTTQTSTSESPDVNLVTQQLSKSQVRGETQTMGTPGSGPRKNGFGKSLLFSGDRETKGFGVFCSMKTKQHLGLVSELVPLLVKGA